ncbi:MAG: DUF192 domain-containing protein [Candidatus Saccharimonadales bacterium]
MRDRADAPSVCQTDPGLEVIKIKSGDTSLLAEVAGEAAAKQRGLSGRDCLGESRGMLFPYETAGTFCYWMKDMGFAIDMIWLDKDKKIVTVKADARPESYPEETYCPDEPANYVLEVAAGTAAALGWGKGTQFSF